MLLTVEQAAERLGTSLRFIRRLRTEQRLTIVKLGKHIRIDSTDLDAYVHANRQEALSTQTQPVASDGRAALVVARGSEGRHGSR